MLRLFSLAVAATFAFSTMGMSGDLTVEDPYARASGPTAKAGAAFMVLKNAGAEDDRLVAAKSDVAQRVELHTHEAGSDGVMRMVELEDGIAVPAGGSAALKRGGHHVMFMGLTRPLAHGDTVEVTLEFEKAGEVMLTIPVDLERKPEGHGHGHGHGN